MYRKTPVGQSFNESLGVTDLQTTSRSFSSAQTTGQLYTSPVKFLRVFLTEIVKACHITSRFLNLLQYLTPKTCTDYARRHLQLGRF